MDYFWKSTLVGDDIKKELTLKNIFFCSIFPLLFLSHKRSVRGRRYKNEPVLFPIKKKIPLFPTFPLPPQPGWKHGFSIKERREYIQQKR